MKGIRLSNGAIFVSDGLITVKLSKDGECGASPIAYEVLEWDLRTESPDKWEYVSEAELRALPDGAYDRIAAVFDKVRKLIGE
jgi:hypothetical protein